MKKILYVILIVYCFCINIEEIYTISCSVFERANASTAISRTEYLEDESYFITVMEEISPGRSFFSNTVTKSKTSTYFNSDKVALWSVTVTGTFTYKNGTSKCIRSSVSATSYNKNIWRISKTSSTYSGNSAIATVTAGQYQSNQLLRIVRKKVTLTCVAQEKFT